ncbi:2-hydroxy-3-oxopropionate reductase [Chromatiales bacterium (ex Bugula neritina AB1)]|nr:2-hydroxy-3-oxopropionate reductase [Chromatiales bacterium (ex Bugula neritina AB1)]
MTNTAPALGFIGLGVMGEPMCRNLVSRSSAIASCVSAYDLNPQPMERLHQAGATTVQSIEQLASEADILFLSLPGGDEVESVLTAPDGVFANAKQGLIIVDLSTSEVGLTRQLAGLAEEQGIRYADAPVARTREAAISGTLAIMVGADKNLFDTIEPYLSCMASDILHCGDNGAGQMVKILNNMVLFQTVLGLSEALTMARRAGLDGSVLFDALGKGSAASFALSNHGIKALLPGNFPEQAFSTRYAKKDLAYALKLAESTQTQTPGAETVMEQFDRAIAAGDGDKYWPVLQNVIDSEKH